MNYEFAKEVGLELRDTYPVRRNGKRVEVKLEELNHSEATAIYLTCSSLLAPLGEALAKARKRQLKQLWESYTPQDREDQISNPDVQHKVRGKWLHWNELPPAEQQKLRDREEANMAAIELLPEEHAEAIKTRAKRAAAIQAQK